MKKSTMDIRVTNKAKREKLHHVLVILQVRIRLDKSRQINTRGPWFTGLNKILPMQ